MKYPKEYLDEIKLRTKKAHPLLLMMKRNFIIALAAVSMETFLIF
jgi:hypothetical protein